jgi:hypothetical protein
MSVALIQANSPRPSVPQISSTEAEDVGKHEPTKNLPAICRKFPLPGAKSFHCGLHPISVVARILVSSLPSLRVSPRLCLHIPLQLGSASHRCLRSTSHRCIGSASLRSLGTASRSCVSSTSRSGLARPLTATIAHRKRHPRSTNLYIVPRYSIVKRACGPDPSKLTTTLGAPNLVRRGGRCGKVPPKNLPAICR